MINHGNLTTALTELIRHTEEIFLSLGEHFPSLLREMEKSTLNSREMIDAFRKASSTAGAGSHAVSDALHRTRETIERAVRTFEEMHLEDDRLLGELDTDIEHLASIEQGIGNIKEDSIEMEIVSLNAMTVALKAGTSGKAFSYITEELKGLSARTITLSEEITGTGSRLLELFKACKSQMEYIRSEQAALTGNIRNRLHDSFGRWNEGVEAIVTVLSSLGEGSITVKTPLLRVMEEIQLQDIIRQSADHILLAMDEEQKATSRNLNERLDGVYFRTILFQLCRQLTEDIDARIATSIGIFRDNIAVVRRIIGTVDRERREFFDTVHLNELSESSSRIISELLVDLNRIMKAKEKLPETGHALMKGVRELEDSFRACSTLLNRFHNVDIASRIEVAKQDVLRNMKSTVEAMSDLTRRIETDVSTSLADTRMFIRGSGTTVAAFDEVFLREVGIVESFEKEIRREYEELSLVRSVLVDRIMSFALYTDRFFTLLGDSDALLDRLEGLRGNTRHIGKTLEALIVTAQAELERELRNQGKHDWSLQNLRLKEIIERFTILTHKKVAADLGGFAVEDGAVAGEVTLF